MCPARCSISKPTQLSESEFKKGTEGGLVLRAVIFTLTADATHFAQETESLSVPWQALLGTLHSHTAQEI